MQSQSLTRSDGVGRSRSFPSFIEYRRKRVPKTPKEQKIPGLEISDTATEKLELLVSLNLGGHPDTKAWKIKAAHELAIRYIAGDQLASPHKTPFDPVKAYDFASMEINNMSIRELEAKFFQLETGERHVNIVKAWQGKIDAWHQAYHEEVSVKLGRQKCHLYDQDEMDRFIEAANWNEFLNQEKEVDAKAIILAWDKQLAAARLAEHYRKLKKEQRDIKYAVAAKFYKRIAAYLEEHQPPNSTITLLLKKASPRFNGVRLLVVRLNKFLTQLNAPLLATPLLKWIASIAGLYFLAELILDLTVLVRAFFYNAKGELDPSFERLEVEFWQDNRPSRMANAIVWFGINLTCLLLTLILPPVGALFWCGTITVLGCVFDVGAEVAIGLYAYENIITTHTQLEAELKKLEEQIQEMPEPPQPHLARKYKGTPVEAEHERRMASYRENQNLIKQRDALQETLKQLNIKITELKINRAYIVGIMTILAVAALLIFFPPAGITIIPIIAASAALVIGSVFGGIGKHLFWNVIMDKEMREKCKAFFFTACRTVKEFFVGKNKTKVPFKVSHDSHDDFGFTSTKHINARLDEDGVKSDTGRLNPDVIHRSPSGSDLLFANPSQYIKATQASPAAIQDIEIKTTNSPLSM